MKATDVKTFGVVGAGQMGAGIAQVAAASGLRVLLADVSKEAAQRGKDRIGQALSKLVDKGKMTADAKASLLASIDPVASARDLGRADIIVEAATESLELKLQILKDVDASVSEGTLLASNTSSISITKLAAVTRRPERFVGLHFMNPVPLMKLVEVVRGVQTSDETYETMRDLALRLGKTVITSKDRPGFMVNRILVPFLNEACFALQEGLGTMEDIDQGAKLGLNHPMGPFELADLIGLDTLLSISEVLHREFGDDKYRPATLLRNLVAAGWYGKKTGRGFYAYEGGQRLGRAFEPLASSLEKRAGDQAMTTRDVILVAREGPIATLTFNRPDKLNALNANVLRRLRESVLELGDESDEPVRAAILTGIGEKAFAAGADIAEMAEFSAHEGAAHARLGHAVCEAIEAAPFPIIAAVNGFALGGGCEMMLACDFALASEKAKIGQPEVNLGITPGFGGTQRLMHRVGIARARELLYTARIVSAEEAKRMGLVNEVYPHDELMPAARAIAALIATKGPLAVAACKRAIREGADASLPAGCELEANAFGSLFGSEDQREGMGAFLRKQTPTFRGRLESKRGKIERVRATRDGLQRPDRHRLLVYGPRGARWAHGAARRWLGASAVRRARGTGVSRSRAGVEIDARGVRASEPDQDASGDCARAEEDARADVVGEYAPLRARALGAALRVCTQRHGEGRTSVAAW
jgi:3-hydroxybutyryl-CoA dehydrogenase